jgi:hypothetical protein
MTKSTTKQWQMVCDLNRAIKKVRFPNQRNFIKYLYDNLDEYMPFIEQLSQKKLNYLEDLWDYYIED